VLLALLAALAAAPLYWLVVPERARGPLVALASVVALGLADRRLVVVVVGASVAIWALMQVAAGGRRAVARAAVVAGLLAVVALFVWNKLAAPGVRAMPSQRGVALLGVSYLVLKAASALVEAGRGGFRDARLGDVLAWVAFLPTYPSGPMEDFDHFRSQRPAADVALALAGLERILFGLVKALVVAHALGAWADPIVAHPDGAGRARLAVVLWAEAVRFYLDFAGYSDVAIGLGAVFGYRIEENFDRPFLRRNLVQLWQRWHMTLTRWLRVYLFIPVTRLLIRRAPAVGDRGAAVVGQCVAMTFCGLWHGLGWNFALWGMLHALGLVWVGIVARDLGRHLPPGVVGWWRRSPLAAAASIALTFNTFAVFLVFVLADVGGALHYLRLLAAGH
jgi:alginate O-acetyltransferase complex protein AlgI